MTNCTLKSGESRDQASLLPPRIEDYVGPDNPVRAIESFVCALDMAKLKFRHADRGAEEEGQPPYDPADLLKLYLYGYINQVRSSRRLEREASRNLDLIWLLKNLRPGYRTIANFRKENWKALKAANREFVLLARELDLVGGAIVAIDGSFFHGDASKASIFTRKRLAEQIAKLDKEIEAYGKSLADNDAAEAKDKSKDRSDDNNDGGGDVGARMAKLMARRSRAKSDLDRLEASGETQLSLTDPDARLLVKNGQGIAGYNVQSVVDEKHKLIVASEVVNDSSDVGQLHAMAKAAKEALDATALQALADEGYYSSLELKACEDDGITAYVPVPKSSGQPEKKGRFSLKDFSYDSVADAYHCPAGQLLDRTKGRWENTSGRIEIRYAEPQGDLRDVPAKDPLSLSEGHHADHPSLGTRRRSRTPSRAYARRRRVNAPPIRDRRASLRYAQMPRRLSALPGPWFQQGSRRVEPDGALLQFHPRAQHPRLRALHGQHCKGADLPTTHSHGCLEPHSGSSERILEVHRASIRHAPNVPRLYCLSASSCPASSGKFFKSVGLS